MVDEKDKTEELPLNVPMGQDAIAQEPKIEVPERIIQAPPSETVSEDVVIPVDQPAQATPAEEAPPERLTNKHFKALKDKAEQTERERNELMRMLQEERSRQPKPTTPEPEEDLGVGTDDFVEGKHLKKFASEIRELRKELSQYKQKTALDVTETKLRTEYPDFAKVFTNENIEAFRTMYPEMANTLGSSSADPYNVAKTTYTMIKKLGIHIEDNYEANRDTVQKNLSKPRPLASASPKQGDSPLSKVNAFGGELTDELKAALWKEVQEASSKY